MFPKLMKCLVSGDLQLPPSTKRTLREVDVLRQHAGRFDRSRNSDTRLPNRRRLRASTQPPPHQRRRRR